MNADQTELLASSSVAIGAPSVAKTLPAPRVAVDVRVATMEDLPFIDALQKANSKGLGYFPTAQLVGYIEMGSVLLAEHDTGSSILDTGGVLTTAPSIKHPASSIRPLGYCISRDRYLKRDELGVIYQLCVVQGEQRKLVGASLVQEVFQRSAYGCRLYCLWCAQDLPANHFWESLGFVPVAFRAGSDRKKRVHIFWQKRIDRKSDEANSLPTGYCLPPTAPYWYPFQTTSGAIRADRLVFPIPPRTHWTEVKAVQLPVASGQLPGKKTKKDAPPLATGNRQLATPSPTKLGPMGGFRFVSETPAAPAPPAATAATAPAVEQKPRQPRAKAPAAKIDPKFLTANRELRDRYLEQINTQPGMLAANGKYDVSRALPEHTAASAPARLLTAA